MWEVSRAQIFFKKLIVTWTHIHSLIFVHSTNIVGVYSGLFNCYELTMSRDSFSGLRTRLFFFLLCKAEAVIPNKHLI